MSRSGAVTVYLVKAFGDGAEGGNPAGVVLDAEGLSPSQKQEIARKIGYSETAFVRGSDKADFGLDFFTPVKQIANCGHATVATFSLLRKNGRVHADSATVETLNGVGSIGFEGETVFMKQTPVGQWPLSPAHESELFASLGLARERKLEGFAPRLASTGGRFIYLGVGAAEDLSGLRPDFKSISALSSTLDAVGYYVFALSSGDFAATTRMFAPYFGIDEESATGMAAGPLAWLLHDELGVHGAEFSIEQGRFMKPPSLSVIQVRIAAAGGKTASLRIGGRGFSVSETSVSLG